MQHCSTFPPPVLHYGEVTTEIRDHAPRLVASPAPQLRLGKARSLLAALPPHQVREAFWRTTQLGLGQGRMLIATSLSQLSE